MKYLLLFLKISWSFFKILEALREKERLTNKDIKLYLEDVEEMNETILSDKYPSPLKEIPNPPLYSIMKEI